MQGWDRVSRALGAVAGAGLCLAAEVAVARQLATADMLGVWRGTEESSTVLIAGEVVFYPNGTCARSFVAGDIAVFQSGTFEVQGLMIHFTPIDWEPKVYLGVPQARPPAETWFVDDDDGADIHARVGNTSMNYRRMQ